MNVVCDLDGVIYRGGVALPGVSAALQELAEVGAHVFFITNNSTRTADATAEKISRVTGVGVMPGQVLTSGMAAMTMLDGDDEPVFVVGEAGLRAEVENAGLALTEDPVRARSVVVGLTRSLSYDLIADAMRAIRNGARFIATNDDSSFPTEDGLAPGCGAIVAAIAVSSDAVPEVAGKPNPPMRSLIESNLDGPAWMIGDRLDTDIALAHGQPGWRSILVLTGITSREAAEGTDADFVVEDFAAAVDLVLHHEYPS